MKERERLVVTGLVVLMLLLWLGFLVHRDPRFAGGFWRGATAFQAWALTLGLAAFLILSTAATVALNHCCEG